MASPALERFKQALRAYRYDPVGFMRDVLDFEPTEAQAKWYRESTRLENAFVAGNRAGKSFGAAGKRIWKCAYRIGWNAEQRAKFSRIKQPYRSVNLGPVADQARLVWNKAYSLLQGRKASWLIKDIKETPFPRIELITGAVIEARSTADKAKRLLGQDFDDVNWDEVALEGANFKPILDNVLRMRCIDRGGTIDYTTTPQGRNPFGLYFLEALAGKVDMFTQTATSRDNPNINQAALKATAQRMSDQMRRQNVEGEIVDGGGTFFPAVDLEAATDRDLDVRVVLWDQEDLEAHAIVYADNREWGSKYPTHRFVHGWDLADKSDWTVGTTWDATTTPYTLVEFERFHKLGWSHIWDRARVRHNKYPSSETWVDSTGVGDVAIDELADIGAHGVNFSGGHKDELLANEQSMLSKRELRWPLIKVLIQEHRWYERDDKNLITDCVMSTVVAACGLRQGDLSGFYFAEV